MVYTIATIYGISKTSSLKGLTTCDYLLPYECSEISYGVASLAIGGSIYVAGGYNGKDYLDTVES
jgi:hypothetical protein